MNDTTASSGNLMALERRLLTEPFNGALRAEYVAALLASGQYAQALAQGELLCQQSPQGARGPSLCARALLALDQTAEAFTRYAAARQLDDFEPVDELEQLAAPPVPAQALTQAVTPAPRLQLVDTRPSAQPVRAIQDVSTDKVRFSSIVGMEELKKTIRVKIIEPYLNPGIFAKFRMQSGGGILLYGPPGCGKTMMARAIANECNAAFISVGISDVLNMYIGESERNLAVMFEKARARSPAVLFFDELDALAFSRSKSTSNTTRTVVNEFLSQLDGIGRENRGVLVLAATNMPWDVDGAMKRPGRFSRQIFVAPPDLDARREMLRVKLTGVPCEGLNLDAVAARIDHFSGADIDGLIELVKESVISDALQGIDRPINEADFDYAISQTNPSTLDWLRTVRNVVKYGGDDNTYSEVEKYLKRAKLL